MQPDEDKPTGKTLRDLEKEIAEAVAHPTLTQEERARRIAELENALGIPQSGIGAA
jgi:hypothetical protein